VGFLFDYARCSLLLFNMSDKNQKYDTYGVPGLLAMNYLMAT